MDAMSVVKPRLRGDSTPPFIWISGVSDFSIFSGFT